MASITIESIREKVEAGERLSADEGVFLYRYPDLLAVGELANLVRERKNGDFAYYNINTHLNPTNICVYRCQFCAFRSDLKAPKGYVMSDEQIIETPANRTNGAPPKCTLSAACIIRRTSTGTRTSSVSSARTFPRFT